MQTLTLAQNSGALVPIHILKRSQIKLMIVEISCIPIFYNLTVVFFLYLEKLLMKSKN